MAKRGRKPTPTPLLKLHGGFRADRHGRRLDHGNVDQKKPSCPRWLINRRNNDDAETVRREGKSLWDRLSGPLHDAGLLCQLYREPFTMLCDSWGRYRLACGKCDSEGMEATGSKGNAVKSPWVSIRNEMYKQVVDLAARFGLTPADLAGVRALDKPTADNGKAKFFRDSS